MAVTSPITTEQRKVLVDIWAHHMVESHDPQPDQFGYTCDERGCLICNADSDAPAWLARLYFDDDWHGNAPTDDELVELAQDWLDNLKEQLA